MSNEVAKKGNHATECCVCKKKLRKAEASGSLLHREVINELIKKDCPEWDSDHHICFRCLNRYRADYVKQVMEKERGDLSDLELQVVESLRNEESLVRNTNTQFEQKLSLGQRVADRMAAFGGSWHFISLFSLVLAAWITYNAILPDGKNFDPFPFILLNLILSCLAAVQAPVIMMSQNRQEEKDRLRGENDYKVNLKAEVEIRNLHLKIDQLMTHQWQHLLEIQEIQTQLMQEMSKQK